MFFWWYLCRIFYRVDKVSVAYGISLFKLKIRSILQLNSNEVKMYFKNKSYNMTKASGMLLLLCSFCKIYAQLYIGKSCDLYIKDSIIISLLERKDSLVSLYIKANTKVHNLQQMSNIKIVVLSSSYLPKTQKMSYSNTIQKAKQKPEEKRVLKLIC